VYIRPGFFEFIIICYELDKQCHLLVMDPELLPVILTDALYAASPGLP
jgi:hypothetical protein